MVYPYEGSPGYVAGNYYIKSSNSRLCVYDNGTTTCGANHKLKTVSYCSSQGIGTYNSTDASFQPAFSICTSDYSSISGYDVTISKKVLVDGSGDLISFGGCAGNINEYQRSSGISKIDFIYVKSLNKSPFDCYVLISAASFDTDFRQYVDSLSISGFQKIIQHNSGFVLRGDDITSDFFSLDVYGYIFVAATTYFYPKMESTVSIAVEDVFYGYYNQVVDSFKNGVTNPSFDESFILNENPAEVCVGDLIAPVLENVLPASGTHLLPFDSTIAFDITDAVGGVDIASVNLTVSGNQTYQTGGYTLITNGVEQVPYVTIGGDKNRYSVLYSPPLFWAANEKIIVNVIGQDLVPEIEEVPFSCTGGLPNTFNYTYDAFVLNQADLNTSITAIADTDAPYLDNVVPTPYTFYADDASDISFSIKDDTTGVNVDTLDVYVNDIKVVSGGVSQLAGGEIEVISYGSYCTFIYHNPLAFTYGALIQIRVVVEDSYTPAPNELDYTYYFYVVSSSTLEIDDFTPSIGITRDLENVDISAYIHDDIYDIDQTNLYLSINGDVCPATITPAYGIRNLSSTVSGVTTLNNLSFYSVSVDETHLQGVSLSYPYFTGGTIVSGSCSLGLVGSFADPFADTVNSYLVDADLLYGSSVSGTISTVLVSGVNWDGKTVNSTISNVDLIDYYATVSADNVSISGTIGATIEYHPTNNFAYDEPINVLIHAENNSSSSKVIKEQVYQLLYGYDIKVFNKSFSPKTKVDVAVRAFNNRDFKNYLYNGFYFTTVDRSSQDLTASITPIVPWVDFPGSIYPQGPIHRYGKLMEVTIYAKDLSGNEFGPYTFSYTIEEE